MLLAWDNWTKDQGTNPSLKKCVFFFYLYIYCSARSLNQRITRRLFVEIALFFLPSSGDSEEKDEG